MARAKHGRLERKVTTRSAQVIALVFALVGALLLYASGTHTLHSHSNLSAFLSQAGGLLLATGLITIAWDVYGRRAFADEVLAVAQVSADIKKSGLTRVTDQYLEEVEWNELFRDVHHLDIMVAYASTWRNTHRSRLEAVAMRKDALVRVFLPDPDDPQTIAVLARRFDMTPEALVGKIREAIADFKSLAKPNGARFEIRVRQGDVVFSCYRFDSRAVVTMYSHSRERRTHVPTFVVADGDLYQFVRDDLVAVFEQSSAA